MVDPENEASVRLVEKLGLTFEGTVRMPGETDEINMYTTVVE
jgi:RimJ/RimL family protein N-acetyltransferase